MQSLVWAFQVCPLNTVLEIECQRTDEHLGFNAARSVLLLSLCTYLVPSAGAVPEPCELGHSAKSKTLACDKLHHSSFQLPEMSRAMELSVCRTRCEMHFLKSIKMSLQDKAPRLCSIHQNSPFFCNLVEGNVRCDHCLLDQYYTSALHKKKFAETKCGHLWHLLIPAHGSLVLTIYNN